MWIFAKNEIVGFDETITVLTRSLVHYQLALNAHTYGHNELVT